MKLVFLGPPGAGKGTQAAVVSKEYRIPHLSTGDMLRSEVAAGSQLGASIADDMQSGKLIADETISSVVAHRIALPDAAAGFLLDGYPRTVRQADFLESLLGSVKLDLVIELVVDPTILIERIQRRAAMTLAGGGAARADDNIDSLRKRLSIYQTETAPLTEYYQRKGQLFRLNGDAPLEFVSRGIVGRLAHLRGQ
ncbi:adenylate kinase [Rhizobium leguminosarum]|uniref:adenylate kinase n=1 Tax=Rhizobium leguminosarum TaxID=384 RepID=UPI003CFECD67